MKLTDSITVLPGIGPKKADLFANLGIRTLWDLITCFPRTYEDRTALKTIAALEPMEPACFEAMVVSDPRTSHIRKGLDITHVTVADETGKLKITFFNQKFAASNLRYGESYLFYGTMDGGLTGTGMRNPVFESLSQAGTATNCILPVYPLTAGLSNKIVRKAVQQALEVCLDQVPEILPEDILQSHNFPDCHEAYRIIHNPESFEALKKAQCRLVFEEFFVFSCGLSLMRSRREQVFRESMKHTDMERFFAALPFRPTGAQSRAIREICNDFRKTVPMNRLLQGDVGSGKTLVASAAMYCAAQNNLQSALMAPTEILAEQHYKSLSPILEPLGIRCCLLTGSMGAAKKRETKTAIVSGQCSVVIGTHALISQDVQYHRLGLVVADEQHRFGVGQRAALAEKGDSPHLLVMSATPIPRTLALILYGDLDVSVLDEKPAGRQSIDTFLVDENMRQRINAFIRKQVAEGHQVYIVCPAVQEDEENSMKSVELWSETLQKVIFPDLRVALLHGQMKGTDKDAIMSAFSAGQFDILVATTVIEVGVDVPNATLMVIENAERFGLSQLHQLRGRVGRGSAKSFCVLFSSHKNPETLHRLKALCKTNDGFRIAEEDLALRGPGDFFGQRQSGLPVFRVANLTTDLSVLTDAKEASDTYLVDYRNFSRNEALFHRIHSLFSENFGTLN